MSKDDKPLEANKTLYRYIIGNLLFVTTRRLDTIHTIALVAWFKAKKEETHVQLVKIIFKYPKGTMDFGL